MFGCEKTVPPLLLSVLTILLPDNEKLEDVQQKLVWMKNRVDLQKLNI